MIYFMMAIAIIQIIVWAFWVMTSTPNSRYEWEFKTKKEIVNYLLLCFIPLLPLAVMLYNHIKKFK